MQQSVPSDFLLAMHIDRAFVRIQEGQVHLRRTVDSPANRPLVALHMSPVASGFLIPLVEELGKTRPVIAPDTLGNGSSCPPAIANPGIPYFADALRRLLDVLEVDRCDLYGVRTGSMIATELALAAPERVAHLVIDELAVPGPARVTGSSGEPPPQPDAIGSQLRWAWQVMHDHFIFYPWWSRDAAHRRKFSQPSPERLHDMTVELLSSAATFNRSYGAAMTWPREERISQLRVPTAVIHQPDPEVFADMRPTAQVIPGSVLLALPHGDDSQAAKGRVIAAWLDGGRA